MAELSAIRAGLAANLRAAFPDAQVSAYLLGEPSPPCFEIELAADGVTYDQAMQHGVHYAHFTVRGIVAANLTEAAQMILDRWAATTGSTSVKAAVESDMTLGGSVQQARVTEMSPFQALAARGGGIYLGAAWTVRAVL